MIIDEAHNPRADLLEDLRLLSNYQTDAENRLCLLLVKQAELRRRIGHVPAEAAQIVDRGRTVANTI